MTSMEMRKELLGLLVEVVETKVDIHTSQVDQDKMGLISSLAVGKIWVDKEVQNHFRFLLVVLVTKAPPLVLVWMICSPTSLEVAWEVEVTLVVLVVQGGLSLEQGVL